MKNKKKLVMIVRLVAMALMSMGYALFATQLNINSIGNITSTWNVYFESISAGTPVGGASNASTPNVSGTSANMNVNLDLPGDSMTYSIVLKNGGSVPAIIEDIDAVATGSGAIIYSISGLKIGDKLAAGASKTITVKIEYDPNTTSQPSETSKQLTITIDAVQDIGQSITNQTPSVEQPMSLSTKILKDNTAYADNVSSTYVSNSRGIDFSNPSSDTNGKGLYYTSTNTEDNKATYYFRGAVENNYVDLGMTKSGKMCMYNGEEVLFDTGERIVHGDDSYGGCTYVCEVDTGYVTAGFPQSYCEDQLGGTWVGEEATWVDAVVPFLWKIVRINENGSIRIITDDIVGTSTYNTNISVSHAATGYMYGNVNANNYKDTHENINDSTIKDYVDKWYEDNLTSYARILDGDAGFCNDRSVSDGLGYGLSDTHYGYYGRSGAPQFACPQKNDLFTIKGSVVGNQELDYPIGILSYDENHYAGSLLGSDPDYYLEKSEKWWTMTPGSVYTDTSSGDLRMYIWNQYHGPDGAIDSSLGVRPVINLRSNVITTKGNGTARNPYVIKIK